jgi:hypothetical protein
LEPRSQRGATYVAKATLVMLARLVQAIALAGKTRKLPFEATISRDSHTQVHVPRRPKPWANCL